MTRSAAPLCVDLDGTLLATDTLWESLLVLIRHQPWCLPLLPFWLIGGKAHFKRRVAERVALNPATLPYRTEVLTLLRAEHAAGRELILATAAHEKTARAVADHLGLFTAVVATNGSSNLSGRAKLGAIERHVAGGFDYIGDSAADLPIWRAAERAILVGPSRKVLRQAANGGRQPEIVQVERQGLRALIRALRPHQWVKNGLLFIPIALGHKITDLVTLERGLLAFVAFCLCASSVYVTNDLLDLEADRVHPTKRRRPFAAAQLDIATGVVMAPALLLLAFALSMALLPVAFTLSLVAYVVLSTAYSSWIKQIVLLDVFLLAGLYTLRVLAGGAATGIVISPWLAAFSLFFFTSLAFLKRYSELLLMDEHMQTQLHRRDYALADVDLLRSFGPSSGFVAVLILALYINSGEVLELYARPSVLWLVIPLFLYWVCRLWLFAHRGRLHEDPIVFAIKDPASYIIGALVGITMLAATI